MKYKVLITSRARLQLVACARWWAEHRDAEQAEQWLDGFERAIDSLVKSPERHALARECDFYELAFPPRQLLCGLRSKPTHRAVFEIRGDTVYVVAVRYLAQSDLSAADL